MAVLASKAAYGPSMGMGPAQPSVVSQYAVNFSNHKASAAQSSQNAAFLSPTESEFSEPSDGQDPIRYAVYPKKILGEHYSETMADSNTSQFLGRETCWRMAACHQLRSVRAALQR